MCHRKPLYRFVSTNLRVILNITLGVLPPDYWIIVGWPEEFCDIPCPCFNGVEPFTAEHMCEVSLNSEDGSRSEMVAKDPERCDGL